MRQAPLANQVSNPTQNYLAQIMIWAGKFWLQAAFPRAAMAARYRYQQRRPPRSQGPPQRLPGPDHHDLGHVILARGLAAAGGNGRGGRRGPTTNGGCCLRRGAATNNGDNSAASPRPTEGTGCGVVAVGGSTAPPTTAPPLLVTVPRRKQRPLPHAAARPRAKITWVRS